MVMVLPPGVTAPVTIDSNSNYVTLTDTSGIHSLWALTSTGAYIYFATAVGAGQINFGYSTLKGSYLEMNDTGGNFWFSVHVDSTLGLITSGAKLTRSFVYDFASAQGGAVGTIPLTNGYGISGGGTPAWSGMIVDKAMIDIITPLTGGAGATAALKIEAANDLVIAAVVAGAPWSSTGIKATIPVGTAATAIKVTDNRNPALVVAVNALTAGKFYLHLEGYQSKAT